MKHQTLFSSKDKSKKLKGSLMQFLFGALWVNFHPSIKLSHDRVILKVNKIMYIIIKDYEYASIFFGDSLFAFLSSKVVLN